jgi:hypothetical protein
MHCSQFKQKAHAIILQGTVPSQGLQVFQQISVLVIRTENVLTCTSIFIKDLNQHKNKGINLLLIKKTELTAQEKVPMQ